MEPVYLLTEPTAAAYAFGYSSQKKTQKILVVDFGGGTLDISILQQFEDGMKFRVLATGGDFNLGGDDISQIVADYLVDLWKSDLERFSEEKRSNLKRVIWKEVSYELFYLIRRPTMLRNISLHLRK